jgi:DNA polymerase-1
MSRLQLIDASIYIFRAYFSLPESMVDADGRPNNAVYGFADFLGRFLRESRATHVAVAFDESLTTSFRNEIYPPYKANRELPPEELAAQLAACRELADALGLATFASDRYEADDLIGTLAARLRPRGFQMNYVTGDKDLAQLLQGGDRLWDYARGERLNGKGIRERLGVSPRQVVDWLALAGDAVDNVPGVPGIGRKTAGLLLDEFRDLDRLYQRLHRLPDSGLRGAKRLQNLLDEHREQAYLSRELVRIATDAPIRASEASVRRKKPRKKQLDRFFDRMDFGPGLRNRVPD